MEVFLDQEALVEALVEVVDVLHLSIIQLLMISLAFQPGMSAFMVLEEAVEVRRDSIQVMCLYTSVKP